MAKRRVPRHSKDAEQALIGAALLRPDLAVAACKDIVDASSFFDRRLGAVWFVVVDMWRHGESIDAVTVADRMVKHELNVDRDEMLAQLYGWQSSTPAVSNAKHYAGIVAEHALARELQLLAGEVAESLYDESTDASEALDELRSRVVGMGLSAVTELPADVFSVDAWLTRTEADASPWVVPGLLRETWRTMLVAPEGIGKTTLTRQIAMAVGQGVHPFTHSPIQPHITLMVDLENPAEAIDEQVRLVQSKLERHTGLTYVPERSWLWTRPAGINIRARTDRAEFEALLAQARPGVVCISPLYKLFRMGPKDNEDRATAEVQEILGDLIARYRFGLIIEHHAPKGAMAQREMFAAGSSLWLRWPEFGLGLVPRKGTEQVILDVMRWKGDRLKNQWPDSLERGRSGEWPWQGVWNRREDRPDQQPPEEF